ncbi:hypothetical protein FQR65_LT18921 [Abscondita terminalis]|nr:hypothetical protein FQR65_LT18921 [Abscondita terminalis]
MRLSASTCRALPAPSTKFTRHRFPTWRSWPATWGSGQQVHHSGLDHAGHGASVCLLWHRTSVLDAGLSGADGGHVQPVRLHSSASGPMVREAANHSLMIIHAAHFSGRNASNSIKMLPPFWQTVTLLNPVVYLVSGFRWAFYGVADVQRGLERGMTLAFLAVCLVCAATGFFKTGYRLQGLERMRASGAVVRTDTRAVTGLPSTSTGWWWSSASSTPITPPGQVASVALRVDFHVDVAAALVAAALARRQQLEVAAHQHAMARCASAPARSLRENKRRLHKSAITSDPCPALPCPKQVPYLRAAPTTMATCAEALIEAAVQLIEEQGVEKLSVREAAKRAGVSPGAPFRHFATRTALLTAVAEQATEHLRAQVQDALQRTPADRLRKLGRAQTQQCGHPRCAMQQLLTEALGESRDERDQALARTAARALVYGLARMLVDGHFPEWGVPRQTTQQTVADTLDFFIALLAASEHGATPSHKTR